MFEVEILTNKNERLIIVSDNAVIREGCIQLIDVKEVNGEDVHQKTSTLFYPLRNIQFFTLIDGEG